MGNVLGTLAHRCEFFSSPCLHFFFKVRCEKGQYVDGLRAPLVIHPPKEVYSYDADYTVVIGDWYHQQHNVLLKQFINIANPAGAEPIPGMYASVREARTISNVLTDSGLIYFAQNGTYLGPKSGTSPTGPTSAVGFNENATLPFEPGKTYRLRIVNTSAFSSFYFWIDGHDMEIIEVDGVEYLGWTLFSTH